MRFFMIAKQIRQPKGDLLQHCVPPNVSGLCAFPCGTPSLPSCELSARLLTRGEVLYFSDWLCVGPAPQVHVASV